MIPPDASSGKSTLPFVESWYFADDPVANEYDVFFALLHFEDVVEWDEDRPWPGKRPHPQCVNPHKLIPPVPSQFHSP